MVYLAETFEAQVAEWARQVEGAFDSLFKEAAQELVSELNSLVPIDTGFLRNSLMASTTAMPVLTRENPGGPGADGMSEIVLVIAGAEAGDVLYLGYTANYAAHVHYGANGRPGRPWVSMVAQRWEQIVATKAAEVRARLGL
jgi:hypothetical protein